MTVARIRRVVPALLTGLLATATVEAALPKVPEGFEVRLVATVPAVLYPCQVATAPDGSLFVAEDPMDQIGPYEAKHGRILLFRPGKDEPVVFAAGFRGIFGMAWYEGQLYVSHMPYLTVLRDRDGDGKADDRKDLFTDLGPTANQGLNDHIVSGLQFGMDGYLYISVGDKGIPRATGPDGRTIQIKGGGTCRCRPDGTGLEVISTGTRNHLDPNLDDRDNLFTYDNTDDGDGWWTRVTHQIDSGYYGYAYDYHDRQDRMLPRIAEFGGGSPCGALIYKEDVWPEKYHNLALWAEWGKGKVHAFTFAPDGATFKIAENIDFAAPDGLANFRPIDLALSYDGRTLYVADWNMGGWGSKTEKVGRVFAIAYKGDVKTRPRGTDADPLAVQIKALDHPSFNERMRAQRALIKQGLGALGAVTAALAAPGTDPVARRHLVWTLDGIAGGAPDATVPLGQALKSPVADVRAQAARALGERKVKEAVAPLVALLDDPEPSVRLQAVIGLGRIGAAAAVTALLPHLAEADYTVAFATRQALRRINDWKAVAPGLESTDPKVRAGLIATLELVYEPDAAALLARDVNDISHPVDERAKALLTLAQAHRRAKPWDGKWWGTRPTQGKPPAKTEEWAGTPRVIKTIGDSLADAAPEVRLAAVGAAKETGDPALAPAVRNRLAAERDLKIRLEIVKTLGVFGDQEALPALVAALRDPAAPEELYDAALGAVEGIKTDAAVQTLIEQATRPGQSAARLVRLFAALGRLKANAAVATLTDALRRHLDPPVRAAAASALGTIGPVKTVGPLLRNFLGDPALDVRKSAIAALGALKDREAVPALITAADMPDTHFEAARALAAIPDPRALQVYLKGLTDKSPDLRKESSSPITHIRDQAVPVLDQLATRHELPSTVLPELRKIYIAVLPIKSWRVLGPFAEKAVPAIDPGGKIDFAATQLGRENRPVAWKEEKAIDSQGQINLLQVYSGGENVAAYAYAEVKSQVDRTASMVVGSDDTLTVWINGKQVYDFQENRGYEADQARVDVPLVKGTNRLLLKCGNATGGWQFSVAFTESGDHPFLKGPATGAFDPEEYRKFALKAKGKPDHGKALFSDLKGLACVKCHAVGGQGGAVGPELSSVGAKYPREEVIASVLYPSARISSGYEPVVVATTDGRVLTGIVKSDLEEFLEIEDGDAKRIRIPKADIDERRRSDVSLMPNGLAEGLTKDDFADLIAYLETLKQTPPPTPAAPGR